MIIWFAILIPVATVVVLLWKFHHKMVWWEYLLVFGLPLFFIALAKFGVDAIQTKDDEYYGSYVVTAEYYEDWNQRVSCSHNRYRTDSKGRQHYVGKMHAYDVRYHPEYWVINTNVNNQLSISQGEFERIAGRFGSRVFTDLNRSYHTNDGDKYVSSFSGAPDLLEPVTTSHYYENRVKASNSVFSFKEVDPIGFGLFKYPTISDTYKQQSILGVKDLDPAAEKQLAYYNATLGATKEVRMYIIMFYDKPIDAGIEQEAFWQGGNKNEFVTCIGISSTDSKVLWAHVFSWTEVEDLKVDARNFVMDQNYGPLIQVDLLSYVNWLGPQVNARFIRKNFDDFNYLTVEPPLWGILVTYFLTLAICVGLGIYAVMNDQFERPGYSFGH